MSTQGKNFVYEFCVLFTRHKIHKQNFCLVYSWVKNTLVAMLLYVSMRQIYIFEVIFMVLLKIHVYQLGLAFLRLDTEK